MRLSLTADQEATVAAFDDFFRKEATPSRVRGAEPLGFDDDLWRALVAVGGPGIAVAKAAGGGGGGMLDAALVAEQHGRRLAPVPLIEASVAAKVLARSGSVAALRQLAGVLQDAQVATVAIRPARAGVAAMVPWAVVADAVIVLRDDRLLLVVPSPRTIGRPG